MDAGREERAARRRRRHGERALAAAGGWRCSAAPRLGRRELDQRQRLGTGERRPQWRDRVHRQHRERSDGVVLHGVAGREARQVDPSQRSGRGARPRQSHQCRLARARWFCRRRRRHVSRGLRRRPQVSACDLRARRTDLGVAAGVQRAHAIALVSRLCRAAAQLSRQRQSRQRVRARRSLRMPARGRAAT